MFDAIDFKWNDEIKIRAYNAHHLKRQIRGRKDCIIFMPYSCSREIEKWIIQII